METIERIKIERKGDREERPPFLLVGTLRTTCILFAV